MDSTSRNGCFHCVASLWMKKKTPCNNKQAFKDCAELKGNEIKLK